jgi:hypothetical protein
MARVMLGFLFATVALFLFLAFVVSALKNRTVTSP